MVCMKHLQPLSDTNPEFSLITFPGFCEYRVENWHLSRDGRQKTISGTSSLAWKDAVALAAIAVLWRKARFSSSL